MIFIQCVNVTRYSIATQKVPDTMLFIQRVNLTRYSPGDVAMIQPRNIEERVEQFLTHMGLDGSQTFYLQQNDSGL